MIEHHARRRHVGILVFILAILATGLSACSPKQPIVQDADVRQQSRWSTPTAELAWVTVPRGTELQVTLSTDIGSATSRAGDTLTATTGVPVLVGDRVAIPMGSTIYGHVTGVTSATKGLDISEKGGVVAISFDTVTTPGGVSTPLSASLTRIATSGGKTAGITGGSAAGGALLGKILGGSSKDAAIGAVLGGAIGTGIAAGTEGSEVAVPAGTPLALTLDEPLTIVGKS